VTMDSINKTAMVTMDSNNKTAMVTMDQGENMDQSEGILISGGFGELSSVEVLNPSTGKTCSLPSLPDKRYYHTSTGLTLCGGRYSKSTSTNCITFSSGEWVTSHTLAKERFTHSAWMTNNRNIILIGGVSSKTIQIGGLFSGNTSETLIEGVTSTEPGFTPRYDTWSACSFTDDNTLIITGGYNTRQKVTRYNTAGFIEDLPDLIHGREDHGCGSYQREDGAKVFLVAGGYDGDNLLSSTEVLASTSSAWVLANNLPRMIAGGRSVSLGNFIYLTGGYDSGNNRDEVLQWTGEDWVEVAKMKKARYSHAASTIVMNENIMKFCE